MRPKTAKATRVQDLPQSPEYGVLLYCSACGGEFSAHRGDYFLREPSQVMRCCRRNLRLVQRQTVYAPVQA